MKEVFVYVEGQTEETFVRDVLSPYLRTFAIYPIAILARTKRVKSGFAFKGGITSYAQVRGDLLRLLGASNIEVVTTMIDYYALPSGFPGKNSIPTTAQYERIKYLESEFAKDINQKRFLPFLVMHEFEALLFTDPHEIEARFPDLQLQGVLQKEKTGFQSPELINEGHDTHPAARILKHINTYQKRLDGPLIASRIGIERIKMECHHFADWLTKLEQIR